MNSDVSWKLINFKNSFIMERTQSYRIILIRTTESEMIHSHNDRLPRLPPLNVSFLNGDI
jgi:hypothetical protein